VTARAIEERDGDLRVVATINGRTRSSIFVYLAADDAIPVAVADANLADPGARAKLLEGLPDGVDRDGAGRLLLRLAAGIAAEQIRLPSQKGSGNFAHAGTLPDPWPSPVDGETLLGEVIEALRRYVALLAPAIDTIALWVVHTYVVNAATFTPYLWVSSPAPQCGKSTLLDVLAYLANRAYRTDGISPAAMFRMIERDEPTLLIDEIDAMLRTGNGDDLRGVLNSGFKRGGQFVRCVGENLDPRPFATFCPKVLSGIGSLWPTVASRSIPIHMVRATPAERKRLSRLNGSVIETELHDCRRRLVRFADDAMAALVEADPDVPDALDARQADIWRPLLSIADVVGGSWPQRARTAALVMHAHSVATDVQDAGEIVLADVRDVFRALRAVRLSSGQIVEELGKMDARPWPEWTNGKPLTARGLARLLKQFGIEPKVMRIGMHTPRGYELTQFTDAFARYLSQESATSATSVAANELGAQMDRNAERSAQQGNSLCDNDVARVADGDEQGGGEEDDSDTDRRYLADERSGLAADT
jgi:hypothetical protein